MEKLFSLFDKRHFQASVEGFSGCLVHRCETIDSTGTVMEHFHRNVPQKEIDEILYLVALKKDKQFDQLSISLLLSSFQQLYGPFLPLLVLS